MFESIVISFFVFIVFSTLFAFTITDEQSVLIEENEQLELRNSYSFIQRLLINIGAFGAAYFVVIGSVYVIIKGLLFITSNL